MRRGRNSPLIGLLLVPIVLISCCGPCVAMERGYGNWLLLALPACLCLLIVSFIDLRRTEHRKQMGLCRNCGYDLRATPGRCPECGAITQPPHNQPTMKPPSRQARL